MLQNLNLGGSKFRAPRYFVLPRFSPVADFGLSPTFVLIIFHPSSHKTHECCQQGKAALSSSVNCKTIAILGATVRVNGGQVFIAVGNVFDAWLVGPEKIQIGEINRLALPSMKLTAGRKTILSFWGSAYFQGRTVSFRESKIQENSRLMAQVTFCHLAGNAIKAAGFVVHQVATCVVHFILGCNYWWLIGWLVGWGYHVFFPYGLAKRHEDRWARKKTLLLSIPLYWLVNRDPHIGLS